MDYTQQQEVTSSCSPSTSHPEEPSASLPGSSTDAKVLRSSARVKAAKQKEKEKEHSFTEQATSSSIPAKRAREAASAKGKGKEVSDEASRASKRARRATYPTGSALTINEPPTDTKGKRRAQANSSEGEENLASSSTTTKRTRTVSAYSLRSRSEAQAATEMTKKTRTTSGKGKAAAKSKVMSAMPSTSRADEDVEMMDAECMHAELEQPSEKHEDMDDYTGGEDVDDVEQHDEGDDQDEPPEEDQREPAKQSSDGLDEPSAMAIFGDYRQLGSYMMGLSSRLKTMLNNIKPTADPTTRLLTLQELSELLSISTEDTLAGSFQVESFVRELVRVLGGTGGDPDEDDDQDPQDVDEDAALAAALAMSAGGGAYQGDENLEAQVLACRCLANLMEALPGVAHTVVYHGAIPVLCSKLIEISYIDLAEQTLSTLEKISEEFPSSIVREGGLAALLNYLDFFSIAVQRTALQAASNCCRNISAEHFPMVRGVWPTIRNCLGYADQRLVEFACLCVIRVVDAYHRIAPDKLESLVDVDLVRAVNLLLLPSGGSPLIAAGTFTLLLRAMATAARASPKITLVLLEAGIVDTLYQILTGVLPPASEDGEEQGDGAGGQGLGGGLADMTVMENLAHRPKDQVEETLSLVSELMPPLPKDGVFDHKTYTERALSKLVKARAKAERAAARQAMSAVAAALLGEDTSTAGASTAIPAQPEDSASQDPGSADTQSIHDGDESMISLILPKEITSDRTELLRSKPAVVGRFLHLMVPILVDVYAASVMSPVRIKTLTGLLKAVSFLEADELVRVFKFVPIATFASSILSSKDHPSLVIGALQIVEVLLSKAPAEYKPAFRREGVLHEIELLAARPVATRSKDKDKDKEKETDASAPTEPPATSTPPTAATSVPGAKKLSSLSLEPDDAITWRARVIRYKYLLGAEEEQSDDLFTTLKCVVDEISKQDASEGELETALASLADLFASPHTSVSSFELLQSGLVDGLLRLVTDEERHVGLDRRRELLYRVFTTQKLKTSITGQTPLATLVKKLQESLTRMESFEVVTVAQSSDDSKRSSPSLLARQLRLRLVAAEDSDVPKSLSNIVVSIHAIATFQALHDYLRPRVAGSLPSGSRLSGMLAALAASALAPPSSSRSALPTSPAPNAAPPDSASIARRRSLRLSAKKVGGVDGPSEPSAPPEADAAPDQFPPKSSSDSSPSAAPEVPEATTSPSAPDSASSGTAVQEPEFTADFTDEEIDVDAEVLEDDEQMDNPDADKTINLSVGEDGSKVEAQTPDGTRVPTPAPAKSRPPLSSGRSAASTGASYAAAVKSKPNDWHLEFFMDDHKLPLDLTIYGAVHQHEGRKKSGQTLSPSLFWQGVYTVKFKKVPGPVPPSESRSDEFGSRSRSPTPPLSSLPEDAPHGKILRLLRVLHKLNVQESERPAVPGYRRVLPESAFVNNKLTAKLTRQLEEPMIVASSCLPEWALDLPQHFPFLFPFGTRYNFLQSTSFGYARLILKWQSQQSRGQDSSRRDDGVGFLGRLQRQKVRISRQHILESAVKVFELYGSSSSILEVEYFEEVGTGLGPTLEFYSLVSKEFARKDLKIWRDADPTLSGTYVHHPLGLFPAPINVDIVGDVSHKRTHIFRVIGQFVAKALLDSRIIDLSFNKVFLKLVLGEEVSLTVDNLRRVDPDLAASLEQIQSFASVKSQAEKIRRKLGVVEDVMVEDLALDFTIPGYDIELRPGGRNIAVTSENVDDYVHEILDAIIGRGAQLQAKAFREGFSKVFPIADLQAFTTDELVMLFGNSEEDWSLETLSEVLKADHGFNVESRAIHDLLEIMSEFNLPTRRSYLQFITGSPRLPIGGFRGLNPTLTVVRKPHEAPLTADDYLPSVMTCVNYLKLPEYSSKAVMREKLHIAMQEGVGSFHLS